MRSPVLIPQKHAIASVGLQQERRAIGEKVNGLSYNFSGMPSSPSQKGSAWIVIAMFAMIAIPGGIALHTVKTAAVAQISSANPTPYGYTWSLLLFIFPIIVIGWWFLPSEGIEIPQLAFWQTILILVPIGCGLDFFLAHRFFVYPNRGATLGIGAPARGGPVP